MLDTNIEVQEQNSLQSANTELITEVPTNNNAGGVLAGGSEFEELLVEQSAGKLDDDDTVDDSREASQEQGEQGKKGEQAIPVENAEQDGGALTQLEYKITYLAQDDDQLVNPDRIKSAVKRYIDNYHSEGMKKYKQLFKTLYQKYSSKRYIIDNTDSEIIVSKSSDKAGSKRDIVFEISKPEYILYNISNKRSQLLLKYQSLVNKLDVHPEEKKEFEKARKKFIDLLERYYIFTLYHNQINNISLEGKSNIVVQELQGFLKENTEKEYLLDGNLYSIDNSLIERINTINSSRLDKYNELMVKLQGAKSLMEANKRQTEAGKTEAGKESKSDKKQKLIEEIKEYLKSNSENAKLNNEIKDAVRVQNTYVDYIISKVPSN
jgi:hypothetical protein